MDYKRTFEQMKAQSAPRVRLDQIKAPEDGISEKYLRLGLAIAMASYNENGPDSGKDHVLDTVVSHWLRIREEQLRERGDNETANRLDDLFIEVVEILYPMTGEHFNGQSGIRLSNDIVTSIRNGAPRRRRE